MLCKSSCARITRPVHVALIAPMIILSGSASAGFTSIQPPTGGEASHAEVFQSFYGGTFNSDGSLNFSNGDITATRIEDTGPINIITLDTGNGSAVGDEFFAGTSVFVIPRLGEAMDETGLGFINGDGSFTPVAPTNDINQLFTATLSGVTRFALANSTTGAVITSSLADNVDGLDHMVTYHITSDSELFGNRWVILFEDRLDGELGFDLDYNDAVFEIIAVPSPASAIALSLLAIPAARRRRA